MAATTTARRRRRRAILRGGGGARGARASDDARRIILILILVACLRALQIVPKTVAQQKLSKDYSQKVEAYNKKMAETRRARTKEGKKKRTSG